MDERAFPSLSRRTLAASALGAREPTTRALTPPPVHVATTTGLVDGCSDNISIHQADALIAELEQASEAILLSSGVAAATAVFLSLPSTHIVASKLMYWGLRQWLRDLPRYGREVTFVEISDLDAARAAIMPGKTGLVWIETASNPLWTITDIRAVAACAHLAGATVCVDSTVSSPVLTRPLDCDSDLVVHSATKYLNGHLDVVAGVIATARRDAAWAPIRDVRQRLGAFLGPFDAFLLLRGLRTLDLLRQRAMPSGDAVRRAAAGASGVKTVLRPGLPDHPGHAIAARQMSGGSGGCRSVWATARKRSLRRHACGYGAGRHRSEVSRA